MTEPKPEQDYDDSDRVWEFKDEDIEEDDEEEEEEEESLDEEETVVKKKNENQTCGSDELKSFINTALQRDPPTKIRKVKEISPQVNEIDFRVKRKKKKSSKVDPPEEEIDWDLLEKEVHNEELIDSFEGMQIGDEKWKAWMKGIMVESPYQPYAVPETKPPVDAIWARWELQDYREGRYVDEDMFEDPYGPGFEGPVQTEDLMKIFEEVPESGGTKFYSMRMPPDIKEHVNAESESEEILDKPEFL